MEAVGYDMYLKLLNEEVARQNGDVLPKQETECTVDIAVDAHIPESYIGSLPSRIGIYKRIADITSNDDASDVIDELCDRFGEPPEAVMGLIRIALLRNRAAANGISEIKDTNSGIALVTDNIREETVNKLSVAFGNDFAVSFIGVPAYIIKLKKDTLPKEWLEKLASAL